MAKLYNLARMTTSTVGAGTLTLTGAVAGYLTFSEAGIQDGDSLSYALIDGTQTEIGRGTYHLSGMSLTRQFVQTASGNIPLSLSGSATVYITDTASGNDRVGGGTLSAISHGSLINLDVDDHALYLTAPRHDLTTRHTLGSVVPHDEHGALSGLGNDDHSLYLRTDGARYVTGSIIPDLSDAIDLGATTRLWRRLYASELDTFVLKANAISVVGGVQYIGKGEGTLPAALAAATTTYDFGSGHSVAANDFLLFRTLGQVEYIQVGTLISGNNYNISRNKDGSGANDWPIGAVYFNLGYDGTGRIELDAFSTPRISIKRQGTTYNGKTATNGEPVRIGDLADWDGIATERWGIGLGDFSGGNYLRYDATPVTGGLVFQAGSGAVTLDKSGILLSGGVSASPGTYAIRWENTSGFASIHAYDHSVDEQILLISADSSNYAAAKGKIKISTTTSVFGSVISRPQINVTANGVWASLGRDTDVALNTADYYALQVLGAELVAYYTDREDSVSTLPPANRSRTYSRNGMLIHTSSDGKNFISGGWSSVMDFLSYTGNDMAAWWGTAASNGYKDQVGGIYPLTLTGGATASYGVMLYATSRRLNGTTGYFYNATLSPALGSNWLAFGVWFYRASTGRLDPILAHGATTLCHYLHVDASNYLVLNTYDTTGTIRQFVVAGAVATGWHFVGFRVWSDNATFIRQDVWYDGAYYTKTHATANAIRTPVGDFRLGATTSAYLSGEIGFGFASRVMDYTTDVMPMVYRMTYPIFKGF